MPGQRGQVQTAYQIQVAGSRERLLAEHANLWDSGKVASSQSLEIRYTGRRLESSQRCFWRVRVWDAAGRPSPWSEPATWTMGILSPAEWRARWIGWASSEAAWKDYTLQTTFTILLNSGGVFFRATGPNNAYMWQVSTRGGAPILREHIRADGGYRVLKTVSLSGVISAAQLSAPHTLRITLHGSQIQTFVDGHLVDATTDNTFSSGGIGFRESDDEGAVFQDIRVSAPDGKVLLEDHFPTDTHNRFNGGSLSKTGLEIRNADVVVSGMHTPLLRHEFDLTKPIRRAWAYASALGDYELRLNGQRVGHQLLAPGWTDYRRLIYYQAYDVTGLVRQGENAIGAQLAPGWYCGNIGWFGPDHYGAQPALFAELHVEYTDGTVQVIPTDTTWKAGSSPITHADNLDGEDYDARLDQPGWDRPGFDDRKWALAGAAQPPAGADLRAQMSPPIRVTAEIKPLTVKEPRPGMFIYDLGQDITGVARVRIQGAAGSTVTIRQAEVLYPDGTLNLATLASPGIPGARALATDTYTFARTGSAVYQPEFTWHGFRYIEIIGASRRPALTDVTGMVMGTDVPHIGQFHTSNALINHIQSNLQWSGRDAYMSIPMDCPQRSERLGWTGDANFYVTTAAFNFDMTAFYSKWARDIILAQSDSGSFPNVAPGWSPGKNGGGYGGGWGNAGVGVPYEIWQRYGDVGLIRSSYPAMARWIAFEQAQSPGLITSAGQAPPGDWKAYGESTDQALIATAYFAYDTRLMASIAEALGHRADAWHYRFLFQNIKTAFTARFVKPDGTVGNGSQTSYVLALYVGLLPDNLASAAGNKLAADVVAHGNHLTTGFVGTRWLLDALTQAGRPDLAYAVLEQTTMPSWGYMVSRGATTIWETWSVIGADGKVTTTEANSLNHCALGSCGDWMYRNIGGIAPDPASPGYKRFIVRPQPGGGIHSARAIFDSSYGAISVRWSEDADRLTLDLTVPVNTTASVYLPALAGSRLTESGSPIQQAKGICFDHRDGANAVYTAGSGSYHFAVEGPLPGKH